MMSKQLIENNHNRDIRLLAKKMLDDLVDMRNFILHKGLATEAFSCLGCDCSTQTGKLYLHKCQFLDLIVMNY
jgi:hypothetical protein